MYRNQSDMGDRCVYIGGTGYVNHAIDTSDESTNSSACSTTAMVVNQQTLYREMMYNKKPQSATTSFCQRLTSKCAPSSDSSSCIDPVKRVFPIISWLGISYNWKGDILGDIISGCTVAIMHIPQGMGYALLANVPPVLGIYTAFFPVLMYALLGTSRHNSMGTFAVVSIMVGKCVNNYATTTAPLSLLSVFAQNSNVTAEALTQSSSNAIYTPVEIATLVSFIVGVIQLLMFVLRLGVLSSLLSECLVSGFTTGAAFHVLTSQIKDLLGLSLPRITGHFKLVKTYWEIFKIIDGVNYVAIIISIITIAILLFNNEILKPLLSRRSSVPIPIELIAVVGGTLIAKIFDFEHDYNLKTVGHIPQGFPDPHMSDVSIWRDLLFDSFAIAFVSYSVTVSMALIFAQKEKYEIDFNQELLAMGAGNILGSFFSCLPFSASLSRSLIQHSVGGKTQLASLISCTLLVFVLLWIGPFFEVLPRCVLASVVVVALKGMLMQIREFFQFKSREEKIVWILTFLTVVIVSIDIGLLIGIVLNLCCILINSLKPHTAILGRVAGTNLFLDVEKFEKAVEIPFVKIFHYGGSMNFATKTVFKSALCEKLGINLIRELQTLTKPDLKKTDGKISFDSSLGFKYLILDFSALTFIDSSSINLLTSLIDDFEKLDTRIHITGCSSQIYDTLLKNDFKHLSKLFPGIPDVLVSLSV